MSVDKPSKEDILSEFNLVDGHLYRKSTGKGGYKRDTGYIYIRLKGSQYGEHRLIHFISSGEWPEQVDHINRVRDDNNPNNLRSANSRDNSRNRVTARGYMKGCYYIESRNKWMVQIGIDGKRKTLGYFNTPEEAANCYKKAAEEFFLEFACYTTL